MIKVFFFIWEKERENKWLIKVFLWIDSGAERLEMTAFLL
jgi:hypothetical protein